MTDDDSGSDDGFVANLSVAIGDFGKEFGGDLAPYQIKVDPIPAAGDCPEAQQALKALKQALEAKENAYSAWDNGYRGTSETLGASGGTTAVHGMAAALDVLARFSPVGFFSDDLQLAAQASTAQKVIIGADAAGFVSHLRTTIVDWQNTWSSVDWTDSTSVAKAFAGTEADLTANGLDIQTLVKLKNGGVGAPGSTESLIADSATLILDVLQAKADFQASLGTDAANKLQYETATYNYIHKLVALENANIDCPPKPKPVPPDDTTPGPNQTINGVQSGDPNTKTATGIGQPDWAPEGSAITYVVDFANDTNASAPAQEVVITDPLAATLDWSTLQLTAIAFNNVLINIPAGVQTFSTNAGVSTDPNPVSVTAALDPATGVVHWQIASIDSATGQLVTDPLAGFLPPDNAQHEGEGYVVYTVQPKAGLATGTQITNQASIVFDVNAAIPTPVTTNYVGAGAPILTAQPLSVTTNLGGTATFAVGAAGSAPYFYQWTKNGVALAGATNAVFTLRNVQVSDAASYGVSVSTGIAQTNSAAAVLTVTTNPSVNQIEIVISGEGAVTPHDNGKTLQIGKVYSLTAVPGQNYLFAGWSGFLLTNSPTLKFVMRSNMLLQASFVANVFLAAHGSYTGLFAPAEVPRAQTNSGWVSFNLTTTGAFNGQLVLGGQVVPLQGKMDVTGAAVIEAARRGETPLTITLQLDLANQAVSGTVSDGSFVSALHGYQAIFSAASPAGEFAGQYSFVIPGADDPAIAPFGTSYGTLTVSPLGTVTAAGGLADGTPFSQSSAVSKEGYWPMYVSLYAGKGSLWGWGYFTNHTITNVGALSWINQMNSSRTALYGAGFTNQAASLAGALYSPSFVWPVQLIATLTGGNLSSGITEDVTLSASGKINESTNKLVLSLQRATGVVSGSFANPASPKEFINIHGILLQSQTNAQGYFLGTNASGIFTLEPR